VIYCLVVLAGASLSVRRKGTVACSQPLSLGIVVPAFNEQRHLHCVAEAIVTARSIRAPIVIVDDGSNDGSSAALDSLCGEGRALLVRHDINRGKAAALNSGISALATDLVLTLDADTVLDAEAVLTAAAVCAEPRIGGVALTIDGAGASYLARMQITEYRYVMNFERLALACLGIAFTIPGSASIWRRRALSEIGGFRSRTCAEDTDATISLSLAGWRVAVVSRARAVTDCPASFMELVRQRSRWIWGTIQAARFALLALIKNPARSHPTNALAFLAVTGLNIFGFVVSAQVAVRFVWGGLGWMEIVAAAILIVTTLIRLAVVHQVLAGKSENILEILLFLIAMQFANAAAFWHGLVTGRVGKLSW
jgi:cellulose synthase/poly-beta-1,6-N-acetylglucosamine synthase-like glycosyltransferase